MSLMSQCTQYPDGFSTFWSGDVVPPNFPLKGHPRVSKPSTLDRLTKFLLKNPTAYLNEVQFWLCVEEGILISTSTLHQYQKYVLGFTNKHVTRTAIERNHKECLQWYDAAQGMLLYTTSKYSVLINQILMTVQEHVRQAMLSVERSVLFHHHFVEEIATLSIQFSLLMDSLLLRSLKA